eukprot:6197965-Pleurochrysis_carterae.AAC.1
MQAIRVQICLDGSAVAVDEFGYGQKLDLPYTTSELTFKIELQLSMHPPSVLMQCTFGEGK